jgi:hypothetical protein
VQQRHQQQQQHVAQQCVCLAPLQLLAHRQMTQKLWGVCTALRFHCCDRQLESMQQTPKPDFLSFDNLQTPHTQQMAAVQSQSSELDCQYCEPHDIVCCLIHQQLAVMSYFECGQVAR